MAKKMKKILGIAMAAVLCTASVAPAMAEGASSTIVEVNEAGQTVTTTTNEAIIEGENGNVTVEVTVHENIVSDPADPVEYEFNETTTTTTVTDENGKVIDTREVVEGTEVTATEKEDNGDEPGQSEVTVELKPGETTVGTVGTSVTTGDPQKNEDDTVYNSTTVETVDRTVEATTGEGEVKVEVAGTSEMNPLAPDRTIGGSIGEDGKAVNGTLKDKHLLAEYTYSGGFEDGAPTKAPEGFDYRFTGQGQMSMYGNAIITSNGSEGRTGALQFELEYDPDFDPNGTNDVIPAEDKFIAYCADVNTGGIDNYWYRLDDLEDGGYYDEEAASYIRAIASNGYWGTSDEPDENGNLQTGSLAKLKADMKAALQAGVALNVTEEEIDTITQGLALNATQLAIWMYANETTDGSKADPNRMIAKGYSKKEQRVDPTEDEIRKARAVYDFLMSLEPITDEETTKIIDAESFIKEDSMSLTVGDKVADHKNNTDDDRDNDVYETSINFALVVTPSQENDDLIVQVVAIGENNESYIAATGRIAGDASNDEGFNEVEFNSATGEYSLKGLNLAENSGFSFDLKLSGTQYLEEGVYIFTSEVRNGVSSQTFVGVAEGERNVDVTVGMTITFDVDEDDKVVAERKWHSKKVTPKPTRNDPPRDPADPGDPGDPTPTTRTTTEYPVVTVDGDAYVAIGEELVPLAEAVEDGLIEILDDEIPLAAVPQTGDGSGMMAMMSLMSLAGIVFLSKKKEVSAN